ncbi:addiction module toxin, HicA family [Bacteroidia bacterium]|nr:addiction module toxin, HicA family [Bacteroidia bacterium]GHT19430.1 addiction module toxin, HicA family [Bacteroidia bacterium]
MKIWKVKEIIKYIKADGWYYVRTTGDHRHFRHSTKKGTTTVPGNLSSDLIPNTAKSILTQAGLI